METLIPRAAAPARRMAAGVAFPQTEGISSGQEAV